MDGLHRGDRLVGAQHVQDAARVEQVFGDDRVAELLAVEQRAADHLDRRDFRVLADAHDEHRPGTAVLQRHGDLGEGAERVDAVALRLEVDAFGGAAAARGDHRAHDVGIRGRAVDADLDERSAHGGRGRLGEHRAAAQGEHGDEQESTHGMQSTRASCEKRDRVGAGAAAAC
jgi:hypothetical protein